MKLPDLLSVRPSFQQSSREISATRRNFTGLIHGLCSIALLFSPSVPTGRADAHSVHTAVNGNDCVKIEDIDPAALQYVFGSPEFPTVGAADLFRMGEVSAVDEIPKELAEQSDEIILPSWSLAAMGIPNPVEEPLVLPPPLTITSTEIVTDENGIVSETVVTSTRKVKVAVIDSGLAEIPQVLSALEDEIIHLETDVYENDCNVEDLYKHGTAVLAEMISFDGNVSTFVYTDETNPDDFPVEFYVIKGLDDNGQGSWMGFIKAFLIADELDVDFIQISAGGTLYNDSEAYAQFSRAISWVQSKGIIVIAAAGNNPNNPDFYPACAPGVIRAGATREDGQMYVLSNTACNNYGPAFTAPGQDIVSLYLDGSYFYIEGTSMAAPYVSANAVIAFALRGREWVLGSIRANLDPPPNNDPKNGEGNIMFNRNNEPVGTPVAIPTLAPTPTPTPFRIFASLITKGDEVTSAEVDK